jgi:PmbA protein
VRGDDILSVSDGQTQRDRLDPVALALQIVQRLSWSKENVSPPIGRVPVLFTAKAAEMLWGTVAAALNGKRVIEGASPWSDRLTEQVISEAITISQNPQSGAIQLSF